MDVALRHFEALAARREWESPLLARALGELADTVAAGDADGGASPRPVADTRRHTHDAHAGAYHHHDQVPPKKKLLPFLLSLRVR
jgi:hypothetical protein